MSLFCTDTTNRAHPGSRSSHGAEGRHGGWDSREGRQTCCTGGPNQGLLRDIAFQKKLKKTPQTTKSLKKPQTHKQQTNNKVLGLPYKAIPLLVGGIIRPEGTSVLAAMGSPARGHGKRWHNPRVMLQWNRGGGWLDPRVLH